MKSVKMNRESNGQHNGTAMHKKTPRQRAPIQMLIGVGLGCAGTAVIIAWDIPDVPDVVDLGCAGTAIVWHIPDFQDDSFAVHDEF
jgi:hypothetical protein